MLPFSLVEDAWEVLSKYDSRVQGQYERQTAFLIGREHNSKIIGVKQLGFF